jgi:hypothetical protein
VRSVGAERQVRGLGFNAVIEHLPNCVPNPESKVLPTVPKSALQ